MPVTFEEWKNSQPVKKNTRYPNPFDCPLQVSPITEALYHELNAPALFALRRQFVAVDLETSGLSAEQGGIVEIGAVVYRDGKEAARFQTLVNPGHWMSNEVIAIHHITNEMVQDHPGEGRALEMFAGFLEPFLDRPVYFVGHNASFDMGFLKAASRRNGISFRADYFDTLSASRAFLKDARLWNFQLNTVGEYFGITNPQAHRAVADAMVSGEILLRLFQPAGMKHLYKKGESTACRIEEDQKPLCRNIRDALIKAGADPETIRFVGNHQGLVSVYAGRNLLGRFRFLKHKAYLLLPASRAKAFGCSMEECTKDEGSDLSWCRVPFERDDPDPFFISEFVHEFRQLEKMKSRKNS